MTVLTDIEIEITKELLLMLKNNTYSITYKDLCDRLNQRTGIKLNPHTELPNKLGNIGKLCRELGCPMINSAVVNADSKHPGDGYKNLLLELGEDAQGKSSEQLYAEEKKRIREFPDWQKLADYLNIYIIMPARGEIIYFQDVPASYEGEKKSITVNSYERNAYERKRCIDHYSKDGIISCQICGFNFGDFYGDKYQNLIEVHHIVPISKIGKSYRVDGIRDLIPVCPNCHMVLHSRYAESIDEIREHIKKNRDN